MPALASIETPAARRTRQLWLFPVSKPLTERLGRGFFTQIPHEPGVYFMYGQGGKLLYIGQSHDLRERLNSYRQVHPDRDRRRLVRLVHAVEQIEWRVCASAEAAIDTEKELLLALRPRFNRANVWPAPKWFIEVRADEGRLELELKKDVDGGYGPFGGSCRLVFATLQRVAYLMLARPGGLAEFPSRLLTQPPVKGFGIRGEKTEFVEALEDYLALRDTRLLTLLETTLQASPALSHFERTYWDTELAQLKEFYERLTVKPEETVPS